MLNDEDAKILFRIAREAIRSACQHQDYLPPAQEGKILNRRAGCFVTIKKHGQLRGCIGNFQSSIPLYREVAQMAIAAATGDPRFNPMSLAELDAAELEITVLTPLEKIVDIDKIEVGRHGIYIEKNFHRGVLLPQVATEYGWDRETFLAQTCIKAGLNMDAWRDQEADIYIFSGQILSENKAN